jgi:hypothetical protein
VYAVDRARRGFCVREVQPIVRREFCSSSSSPSPKSAASYPYSLPIYSKAHGVKHTHAFRLARRQFTAFHAPVIFLVYCAPCGKLAMRALAGKSRSINDTGEAERA